MLALVFLLVSSIEQYQQLLLISCQLWLELEEGNTIIGLFVALVGLRKIKFWTQESLPLSLSYNIYFVSGHHPISPLIRLQW